MRLEASRLEQYLKHNFDGPEVEQALRRRLEIHLEDPTADNLSWRVWGAYLELTRLLKEPFSILDCGCMSGFLYHHLSRHFRDFFYTGIDRWPEALKVAREKAPGVDFRQMNFMEPQGLERYDYVWLCNIAWSRKSLNDAVRVLSPLTERCLLVVNGVLLKITLSGKVTNCGESNLWQLTPTH